MPKQRLGIGLSWCIIWTSILVGCGGDPDAAINAERPLQKVRVVSAEQREITQYVDLVGRTEAFESVEIKSRVSGFLQKIHFTDGQLVKAGDLLFTIEPDEYEATLAQSMAQVDVANSRLEVAEKTFARSRELLSTQAISQEEFDENQAALSEARARVVAAKADADRVKLDVNYTQIISPIDGRVDRALLDAGNFVTGGLGGGTTLTTVIKDQPIKAIANVDENVRLRFMRRQRELAGANFEETDKLADKQIPCYLQLQDESGFPREGRLDYAEIRIDQQTGTSQIRGVFANEDGLLKPGMFVRLRVPVSDAAPAVLVPDVAIATDQATKYVLVVDEKNEIQQRSVQIGQREGSERVVLSGIQPNERVVTAGLQLVRPGMQVDPIEAVSTEAQAGSPENAQQ